jgi:NAD(P)-dependent dehydrogenase (short-subunit alcohol dehydrogenase family)
VIIFFWISQKRGESKGSKALAIKANVGNHEEVQAMFKQVTAELGPVDVLINNAGDHT